MATKKYTKVDPLKFDNALSYILRTYGDEAMKAATDVLPKVAKDSVKRLKVNSPSREHGGDYARSWTYTKDKRGKEVRVYNKDHYRLTHLLENGHLKRNGVDRTDPIPHIAPAEEQAIKELEFKVKEALNDL